MTQACNSIFRLTEGSPLYGLSVEKKIALGSAHFASAFAEIMTRTAVAELRGPSIDIERLDIVAAHLSAAIDSYRAAVDESKKVTATRVTSPSDPKAADVGYVETGMLKQDAWERVLEQAEDPSGILEQFLAGLIECSRAVESVLSHRTEDGLVEDSRLLWKITTPMTETLMYGQAAAALFQRDDFSDDSLLSPASTDTDAEGVLV